MNTTVVLIPVYNNLKCLSKTLKSIKHKEGIDILIVDDGCDVSQKPRIKDLKPYLNDNVSLEIIRLKKNSGITESLNFGLKNILKKNQHKFIARIDCGDICVNNRFKVQEEYLLNNENIDIVGSWVNWLDSETGEKVFCKKPPTKHSKIKKQMSLRCSIIHPSTMFRLSVVKNIGMYPTKYEAAEDYAYFFEISKKGKVANIPKFLTSVEHNPNGISNSKRKLQNKSKMKVILDHSPKNFNFLYSVPYNLCLMSLPASSILKMKMKIFKN